LPNKGADAHDGCAARVLHAVPVESATTPRKTIAARPAIEESLRACRSTAGGPHLFDGEGGRSGDGATMNWSDAAIYVLWASSVFAALSGGFFKPRNRHVGFILRGLVAGDEVLYFCWFDFHLSGLNLAVSLVLAAWWNLGAAWLLVGSAPVSDE
jgi:hypothetical protein